MAIIATRAVGIRPRRSWRDCSSASSADGARVNLRHLEVASLFAPFWDPASLPSA